MMGGAILPIVPVVCTAPVKYKGEAKLEIDIANVKAAAKTAGVPDHHVFLPATAPSGVGINEYYKSEEAVTAAPLYPRRRKGIRPLLFDLISSWRRSRRHTPHRDHEIRPAMWLY
jgi:hypothetical protein